MSGSRYKNAQLPQTQSPLFGAAMPRDVREQIVYPFTFGSKKAWGMFAATCQKAEADTAFLCLMNAAVEAEPMSYSQEDETSLAAIAILKRHPKLLFVKGMVTDHFGRKIFASPYQLFLGAGDVWALKQVHEKIISKIEDEKARAHMQEQAEYQFQQQFPNCKLPFESELGEAALYDERNEAMIAQVIVQLETIVEAITADPCTNGIATRSETEAAVAKLRQLFAPKQGEVIKTGLHFPLAIMREIFSVYDAQFAPWTGAQLSFFTREVIGAVLDASTAVDGQCCKVGLSNLNAEKGPDRCDGLFCRHPKGIPQELAPIGNKLGRTMFVDPYDGESVFLSAKPGVFDCVNKNAVRGWWRAVVDALGNLCRAKTSVLAELMRPQREEKTSRCACVVEVTRSVIPAQAGISC